MDISTIISLVEVIGVLMSSLASSNISFPEHRSRFTALELK
mgnify:CR=1 FL=1